MIKVITGIRRCGKSMLMELFQQELLQNDLSKENIVSINLEDDEYFALRDPQKLHAYILECAQKTEGNHLAEIDANASIRYNVLVKQLMIAQGITEQLKEQDQLAWIGGLNNIRSAAEEFVNTEVVYT